MGLDSYLYRMPRYKNTTASEVSAIEGYLNWLKAKKEGSKYANCTLKEWCDVDESELPSKDVIEFYKPFHSTNECGYGHIMEEVGYWRKANQIHNFFVENVQDGEDDCSYHNECTKEILEDLLDKCYKVLTGSIMMIGQVKNGQQYVDGEWVDCMEPGKVIINPEVAEELLPSCRGFFFGSTEYDEYYMQDIEDTIKIIKNVLATTDFETQMLAYRSSW
jgi:hypothetical protein